MKKGISLTQRAVFLMVSLMVLPGSLFAGQTVFIEEDVSAYLALPKWSPELQQPAIVLIHEWWGLNDQIRGLADRFAEKGFVALAVDLYRGEFAEDHGMAHELSRGLPEDRAFSDLKAVLGYLENRPDVNGQRIGVIGWCMGGGWALKIALKDSRVQAVNMYYGRLVTDEAELRKLRAPLLGIFGGEDRGIPADSVKRFEAQLEKLGKRAEIYLYPDAGHAFANPENSQYRPKAARDAWEKTLIFFKANLS